MRMSCINATLQVVMGRLPLQPGPVLLHVCLSMVSAARHKSIVWCCPHAWIINWPCSPPSWPPAAALHQTQLAFGRARSSGTLVLNNIFKLKPWGYGAGDPAARGCRAAGQLVHCQARDLGHAGQAAGSAGASRVLLFRCTGENPPLRHSERVSLLPACHGLGGLQHAGREAWAAQAALLVPLASMRCPVHA